MNDRTTATTGGHTYTGSRCADCGTPYATCIADIIAGRDSCCSACYDRDAHAERIELKPRIDYAAILADIPTEAIITAARERGARVIHVPPPTTKDKP